MCANTLQLVVVAALAIAVVNAASIVSTASAGTGGKDSTTKKKKIMRRDSAVLTAEANADVSNREAASKEVTAETLAAAASKMSQEQIRSLISILEKEAEKKELDAQPRNPEVGGIEVGDMVEMSSFDNTTMTTYCVGQAWGPHRFTVRQGGVACNQNGWSRTFKFNAWNSKQEGLTPYCVGDAYGPHRYAVREGLDCHSSLTRSGWRNIFTFYAVKYHTCHRSYCGHRYCVGDAFGPHRYAVKDGSNCQSSLTNSGWRSRFSFYGQANYDSDYHDSANYDYSN